MALRINLTGWTNGVFTVSGLSHLRGGVSYWNIKCQCGRVKPVRSDHVKKIKSCGCLTEKLVQKSKTKHNMSKTVEYKTWASMKARCYNKAVRNYYRYGGRGIKVCDRWRNSFSNFYADMGKRPKGKSIDRIDNELGYYPENCRWASNKQQANNTRNNSSYDYNGQRLTLSELSELSVVKRQTLGNRLKSGWSVERAVNTPAKLGNNQSTVWPWELQEQTNDN